MIIIKIKNVQYKKENRALNYYAKTRCARIIRIRLCDVYTHYKFAWLLKQNKGLQTMKKSKFTNFFFSFRAENLYAYSYIRATSGTNIHSVNDSRCYTLAAQKAVFLLSNAFDMQNLFIYFFFFSRKLQVDKSLLFFFVIVLFIYARP